MGPAKALKTDVPEFIPQTANEIPEFVPQSMQEFEPPLDQDYGGYYENMEDYMSNMNIADHSYSNSQRLDSYFYPQQPYPRQEVCIISNLYSPIVYLTNSPYIIYIIQQSRHLFQKD